MLGKKITDIKNHIKKVYLTYERPFVVGFSGGKDSTAALQLIWEVIRDIPESKRLNNIHVICTDTLVETPYLKFFLDETLAKIKNAAISENLPITVHKLTPLPEKRFWTNLIGKGYPAPSQMFRWCTERLKIDPVNRFIQEQVSEYNEATIVLGARKDESASRQQVLNKKKRDALGLSKHPILPEVYVFTPIENLTTDEVWQYLATNNYQCLWGGSNRDLMAIYKNASGGECPMVIDTSTPSCGNSRFGCWVCTLVISDTSMENLIDSGEDWMIPLLEFREFLCETQKPDQKGHFRRLKRRSGKVYLIRDKSRYSHGPYKFEWRKEFLRRLLKIQKKIQADKPEILFSAISMEELELIRQTWRNEEHDWEDSVPAIYKEMTGDDYPFKDDDCVSFTSEDKKLLYKLCENKMHASLIAKLIDLERNLQGMTRRAGIMNKIDKIFSEDWRTEEELNNEINQAKQVSENDY